MLKTQKHTPGPWKCNPIDRAHNFKIFPIHYETPVSTDETLANARLIAAAPELLEACKTALAYMVPYHEDVAASEAKAVIRRAIAKAEGKEK